MQAKSQLRDPFGYGNRRRVLSAWAMAIVFATVAVLSFAIDQAVSLAPNPNAQSAPSLFHPVQLIHSLIDAASE
jgi:hypothetical protein